MAKMSRCVVASLLALLLLIACHAAFAADAPQVSVKYDGSPCEFDALNEGCKFFSNVDYKLKQIPKAAAGLKFTRLAEGKQCAVDIDVSAGATVFVIVGSDFQNQNAARQVNRCPDLTKKLAADGWEKIGDAKYATKDGDNFESVFKRHFVSAKSFTLSGGGWTGISVASQSLTEKGKAPKDAPAKPGSASIPTSRPSETYASCTEVIHKLSQSRFPGHPQGWSDDKLYDANSALEQQVAGNKAVFHLKPASIERITAGEFKGMVRIRASEVDPLWKEPVPLDLSCYFSGNVADDIMSLHLGDRLVVSGTLTRAAYAKDSNRVKVAIDLENCILLENHGPEPRPVQQEPTPKPAPPVVAAAPQQAPPAQAAPPSQTSASPSVQPSPAPNDAPISGPTTRVSSPVTSIKALEIYETESGMMLGQTSEVVLTATRGETPHLTGIQFVTPVGDDMGMARDEALRFIRVTYPNWYVDKAEITFEDKYVAHSGGSIGTALGTLVMSSIQGFEIASDVAMTGDISANGKVRAIGGVAAKLRGATAGKCKIAAIPMENYDQLVDAVIYGGPAIVTDIQVIGLSNLNDAVATARTDRAKNLTDAIALFATVQDSIAKSSSYASSKAGQEKLAKVLELAPQHLSAKLLLASAQGKLPKSLSATASRYYTFLAAGTMLEMLQAQNNSKDAHPVASSAVKSGLTDLRKLRPLADPKVRPLIDAWVKFIGALNDSQQKVGPKNAVDLARQSLLDEMAKEQADPQLMQKMLKEGM